MIVSLLRKAPLLKTFIYWLGDVRSKLLYKKIKSFLDKDDKILDIGAGPCNLVKVLREKGYRVTPIDVQNISFVKEIKPTIFDGKKIPFPNNSFDVSLLLTTLHHIKDPENTILEAKRVSKKIVIIEDIYENALEKYLTFFFDSIINFEYLKHPHSNKSDKGWKRTFRKLGLKLISSQKGRFLGFRSALYLVEK